MTTTQRKTRSDKGTRRGPRGTRPVNSTPELPANDPQPNRSVISKEYKRAARHRERDALSKALELCMLEGEHALRDLCKENDIVWAYGHLNPGMQRMNVGNRLRAKGNATRIQGMTVEGYLAYCQ